MRCSGLKKERSLLSLTINNKRWQKHKQTFHMKMNNIINNSHLKNQHLQLLQYFYWILFSLWKAAISSTDFGGKITLHRDWHIHINTQHTQHKSKSHVLTVNQKISKAENTLPLFSHAFTCNTRMHTHSHMLVGGKLTHYMMGASYNGWKVDVWEKLIIGLFLLLCCDTNIDKNWLLINPWSVENCFLFRDSFRPSRDSRCLGLT